ncbi:MAG TPA: T9SS type A sorting domain-containing protein [Flavipsychrobacter sp.]|nr:T9SS type A sorting domain-containing protein [Flavipsychrobacter sp.]
MKSKIYLLLFIFCIALAHKGNSQNILKQGFNSTSLPAGWGRVVTFDPYLDGINWQFLNSAGGASPHSGSNMAVMISALEPIAYDKAYLCTYSLDFSKDTTGNIKASFWMFRDTGIRDSSRIDMYVSTSPYPWMGSTAYMGTLWVADSPVVSSRGWYQYTFSIPDSFKGKSNYVIWWATSDTTNSELIDDVSIDQYSADTLKVLYPEQDTLVCMGGSLAVTYGANHLFNIGNVFKVELSDSGGSFASPTIIGTDTTNTLDVVNCTLPSVMSTTKSYRLRIVSTSPAETSPDDGYDIHVTTALNSAFTATSNSPICWGDTAKLIGSTTDYDITYTWRGPYSFLSNEQNPEIPDYKHFGTGTYSLTISRNGCPSVSKNVLLEDDSAHPALPTDSSNTPVCAGSTLKLYAGNTLSGGVYNWSGPDTFSSTAKNPTIANIKVSDSGKYYVYVQLHGCRSATDSIDIKVNVTPAMPSDSSNSPVCSGSELKLFSKDDTSGVTYSWSGPDSFASSVQNPTIATTTLKSSGFYYVAVEKNGCLSHLDSINVKINPVPVAPSDSSNGPVCLGSKLELFSKDDTSGVTYSWSGPDSFASSVQNPTIAATIAKDSGFYFVVAKKNGCLSSTDSIHIAIDSVIIPTVKISVSPDTLVSAGATVTFTATVTGGGTSPVYKWLKNNVVIPGATTNTYVTNKLANKDVITAIVQSNAMCAMPDTAMSNAIRIGIIPTDVYSLDNGSNIALYPNPNNGSFIIKGAIQNSTNDKTSIEIVNIVGQTIYNDIALSQNGIINKRIDLSSNIPNGLYVLRLKTGENHIIMRFTLQR